MDKHTLKKNPEWRKQQIRNETVAKNLSVFFFVCFLAFQEQTMLHLSFGKISVTEFLYYMQIVFCLWKDSYKS